MPRSPSQPTVALNAPPRPTLSLGHHRTLGKRVGVVGTGGLDHYAVLLGAALGAEVVAISLEDGTDADMVDAAQSQSGKLLPHAADGSAYVYEGMRIQSVVLGLPRKAVQDVTITDGDREIFVKAYHRL
ncbi:hypothetical protein V8E36_008114 [Tilletia maclaganii]